LQWANPYTEPPDGGPRVLAEVFVPAERLGQGAPPCPEEIASLHVPGSGYVVCIAYVDELVREMSVEGKALIRRKRLRRRLETKYPMFADKFYEEDIEKKPEYYQGITDPDIQAARDEVIAADIERRRRLGIPLWREK